MPTGDNGVAAGRIQGIRRFGPGGHINRPTNDERTRVFRGSVVVDVRRHHIAEAEGFEPSMGV